LAQRRSKLGKSKVRLAPKALAPAVDVLAGWMEATLMSAFWGFSRLLPLKWASALGFRVMHTIGPRLEKSRHIRRNLELAFPDWSPAELTRMVAQVWGNFGSVMAEYPHLEQIVSERLEIVGKNHAPPLQAEAKPAIFVTGHMGNWELAAATARVFGVPLVAVYNEQSNPIVNQRLMRLRQALGCDFLTKEESLRRMIRYLSKGTSVGILMDQRVDPGADLPFFGLATPTTPVPARLALKYAYDIVPIFVERLPGPRFRVVLRPALKPRVPDGDLDSQALDVTQQINDAFEAWIRKHPDQWFCYKRRWPKSIYKPGQGAARKTADAKMGEAL